MTAWWQHAVSKSETLLLSQKGCFLEDGGQDNPYNHHSDPDLSWQYGGSVLSQSGTLSFFSALTLFVGRHGGHPACKSSATTIPKSLLLGTGLTWSNVTWKKNRVCCVPSVLCTECVVYVRYH